MNLSDLELLRGRYSESEHYSRQSVEVYRLGGHAAGPGAPLANLGLAALAQGEHERAEGHLRESLRLMARLGHTEYVATALDALAAVENHHGRPERGAELLGAATALREEGGFAPQLFEASLRAEVESRVRSALVPDRFEQIFADAHSRPWDVVAQTAG